MNQEMNRSLSLSLSLSLALSLSDDDVVSMADSTITADDIEGELFKIERIRDVLVRRESELRYMWVNTPTLGVIRPSSWFINGISSPKK